MRNTKPISVLTVALVSAAVYGGGAVVCVPTLSFLFALTKTGGPAVMDTASSDTWMTMAVLAPLFCALMGLISGTFMALMFNLFARQVQPKPISEPVSRVRAASVSDAA
jgi:hypothetical protein